MRSPLRRSAGGSWRSRSRVRATAPMRSCTSGPATAISGGTVSGRRSSSRSARSDRTSHPSPPGRRCGPRPGPRIEHATIEIGARQPRRVRDDDVGAAGREQVPLLHLDLRAGPPAGRGRPGRTRPHGPSSRSPPPAGPGSGQHRGQHARPGPHVEGQVRGRERDARQQVQVVPAGRGEHFEVRMDAPVAERGDDDAAPALPVGVVMPSSSRSGSTAAPATSPNTSATAWSCSTRCGADRHRCAAVRRRSATGHGGAG